MPARIWLDVEDIFEFAAFSRRPTGIQRVQMEICRALVALDPRGERVTFIRHDPPRQSFRVTSWERVEALFESASDSPAVPREPIAGGTAAGGTAASGAALRRLAFRLPAHVRLPLVQYLVQQRSAFAALGGLARAALARRPAISARDGNMPNSGGDVDGRDFEREAREGDVILVLGAAWYRPDYAALIERHRAAKGLRFAAMIYDMIPLLRPEWSEQGHARAFAAWFRSIAGLADPVLTISEASARDIARCAAAHGIALRRPVEVLRLGTGFAVPAMPAAMPRALPPPGSYALMVSTLEARKNHALLFRVWRRLLDALPAEEVPSLVLAGRVGWMVADLMTQMRNSAFLDGKIVLIEDASDAELAALYRGCRFTLFPSFYEGWGLPVTESLAFGKPCLISDAAALPEAGGDLARYFDPDDAGAAYRLVREMLARPEALADWEARVRRGFRPVAWSETAAALLRAVEPLTACPDSPGR